MIEVIQEVIAWFDDPATWTGTSGIPNRMLEHVVLSAASIAVALLVAVPVGLVIGHTGRGATVVTILAGFGRAMPSYALLIVLFSLFYFSYLTPLLAMVALAVPPILTNTYVGLREVDRDTIEAGRGMGMTEWQLLRRVELPLAMPIIVAGARTAAVQVVATATLAALVGLGGLGRFIVDGFGLRDEGQLVGGALLVALLALVTERSFTLLERRIVSPGVGGATGRAAAPRPVVTSAGHP